MIHWLSNAISTYLLHGEHGNGYQWWSGEGSDLTEIASVCLALLTAWHRFNCHHKGCPRVVRHGKRYCPKHEGEHDEHC